MTVNILSMIPLSDAGRARIEGIDPSIELVMAPNWFHGEYRDTWPGICRVRICRRTCKVKAPAKSGMLWPRRKSFCVASLSLRCERPRAEIEMVSSDAGGCEQPPERRSLGERRRRDDIAGTWQYAVYGGMDGWDVLLLCAQFPPSGCRSDGRRFRASRLRSHPNSGQNGCHRCWRHRPGCRQALQRDWYAGDWNAPHRQCATRRFRCESIRRINCWRFCLRRISSPFVVSGRGRRKA